MKDRKRFRVSRQGVVIEVLDDKTKEAQPSSSEEESVVIEDEIYQESDTDESQGAHSESEHDYIPRAEPATDAIPTTPNDWGTLYGYQGSVPFIRHNRKSYATAVRNLLSLQLYDETKYSVVHYDAKTGKKVDEIWARVPIHREDAGQKYVSDHFHWHHDNDEKCCAFFVKRIHEDVPLSWQPTAAQLFKDIVRISYDIPCIDPNGECAPKAQCYVSLPQMKEPLEARKELSRWGANQYSPYMQTALEVLVGRDPDTFKHSFFKLFRTGTDLENTGSFYGPVLTPPSQLNLMIPVPMQTSMPLTVELHQQPIEDDHIVFMLPGHYPRRDPVQAICVKGERSEPPGPAYRFRYSLATIQALLKNAFRADYPLIRRVSLVDGVSMFDPGMITGEPLSIEMPNEPKMGDKDVDVFLSNLVQGNQRFVIIYPEWDVKDTRMIPEWEPDCHDWVEMVPLKSTLNEFITKVAELRRLSCHMMKDLSRYCISLQAVSKTVPQTNDATQAIDFPSYMVTPFTKHEEWYRIRAMIPTRDVKISILEREYTSWKLRIPKSNVWGPRYSFVDAEHKILWAEPPWRPLPLPPSAYIPRAPISDASLQKKTRAAPPERLVPAATPLDHTQARVPRQHAANSEASDIAEAAEAEEDIEELERARDIQPSIFAGHNHLLAWPSNVKLRVPTEAPLMENMLKTSENVPQVSRAILTPSEQARLQSSFWQMRNLALKRTLTCMFKDCGFSYRLGDEKALNQHLHLHHLARKCTWCDEPLYEWWNEQQRADHMRRSHKSKLLETLGVKNASLEDCASKGSVVIPLKRVHEIAGQQDRVTLSHVNDPVLATSTRARFQGEQIFCERCGRNSKLFSKIEETQHSQICQPKILNGAKCTFCAQCGTHNWSSRAEATKGGLPAAAPLQCDHSDSDDAADTHCWKCGLDLKQLDPSLRRQHSSSCKGYSAEPDRCCCYCGMIFWTGPNQERQARRTKHLQECLAKLQPGVQLGLILQGRNDLSSARVELPRPTVRKKRLLPQKDRQRRTKPDVARADTTDSSESDRPIRKKAKGKAVKPTRRRVDLSWSNDDDDDDESSSGERGRQTGQQRDSRRRAESPDWTKKLGPEDPNFVPRDHYCSRCFRKAPKIPNRPQKVGPDKIDVHQQIDVSILTSPFPFPPW